MSRIEKGLHDHHARLAEQANNPAASQTQAALGAPPAALEAPFAKVSSVVAGSPAETAGLKAGDTITKFGWVDWTNHERLSRVAEAVSQNEGVRHHTGAGWLAGWLARLETSGGSGLHSMHSIFKTVCRWLTCTCRFPSPSRRCDPTHRAVQQRVCRCSSHHGATGAGEGSWAATCCPCKLLIRHDIVLSTGMAVWIRRHGRKQRLLRGALGLGQQVLHDTRRCLYLEQ